jgi:hypothetical protein
MRLLIKQRMRDKYTGEIYEEGAVKNFKADRAKELLADPRGLAEEAPAPAKKASAKSKKKTG